MILTGILCLITLAVLGLLLHFRKKQKEADEEVNMAEFGIQTFDTANITTFNTNERLFKYIGTKNIKYGKFSFTVTEKYDGQLVFIVSILHSVHRKQTTGYKTNIPNLIHLQNVSINGKTISGEVVCIFPFSLSADDSDYVQIVYGAY
ncbi:MAG: hypothetical protein SOS93_05820 [Mannheimia varigena]|nr:hypothetical protein [Mannheimia varigena]